MMMNNRTIRKKHVPDMGLKPEQSQQFHSDDAVLHTPHKQPPPLLTLMAGHCYVKDARRDGWDHSRLQALFPFISLRVSSQHGLQLSAPKSRIAIRWQIFNAVEVSMNFCSGDHFPLKPSQRKLPFRSDFRAQGSRTSWGLKDSHGFSGNGKKKAAATAEVRTILVHSGLQSSFFLAHTMLTPVPAVHWQQKLKVCCYTTYFCNVLVNLMCALLAVEILRVCDVISYVRCWKLSRSLSLSQHGHVL